MGSIEVITSQEREVKVKQSNGKTTVVLVKVWNETVSNLTLMALGILKFLFCNNIFFKARQLQKYYFQLLKFVVISLKLVILVPVQLLDLQLLTFLLLLQFVLL